MRVGASERDDTRFKAPHLSSQAVLSAPASLRVMSGRLGMRHSILTDVADCTSYRHLLSISGSRGVLRSVGVAGGDGFQWIRVTLDGTQIVDQFLCVSYDGPQNTGLSLEFGFERDLLVEAKDSRKRTGMPRFWIAYSWNRPAGGNRTLRTISIDGVPFVYERREYPPDQKSMFPRPMQIEEVSQGALQRTTVTTDPTDTRLDPLERGYHGVSGSVLFERFDAEERMYRPKPIDLERVQVVARTVGSHEVVGQTLARPDGSRAYFRFEGTIRPTARSSCILVHSDVAGYSNRPAVLAAPSMPRDMV